MRYTGGHDLARYRRVIEALHTHGPEGATSLSLEKAMVLIKTARAALRLPAGAPARADELLLAYVRGAWETDRFTPNELRQALDLDLTRDVFYLLDILEINHRRGGKSRSRRPETVRRMGASKGNHRRQFI